MSSYFAPTQTFFSRTSTHFAPLQTFFSRMSTHFTPMQTFFSRMASHFTPTQTFFSRMSTHFAPLKRRVMNAKHHHALRDKIVKSVTNTEGGMIFTRITAHARSNYIYHLVTQSVMMLCIHNKRLKMAGISKFSIKSVKNPYYSHI